MSDASDPSGHRTQSDEIPGSSVSCLPPPPSNEGFSPGWANRPAFVWTLTILAITSGAVTLFVAGQPQVAIAWGSWNLLILLLCVPFLSTLNQTIREQSPREARLGVVFVVTYVGAVVTLFLTGLDVLAWIILASSTVKICFSLAVSFFLIRSMPKALRTSNGSRSDNAEAD
ncbi:MAG: hypothetical protein IOD15_04525 [Phycisphaerales bacterium]|jgi:hypothetical protein|nr:hypothetical protein [Phycisphaerales bacterium]